MANILKSISAHKTWEDWVLMGLGVLILLSPWLAAAPLTGIGAASAIIIGMVVLVVAGLELFGVSRWEDAINLACGLWLIASPFLLGYGGAGQLRFWHIVLGALVALVAATEFWQDRNKAGGSA